jgi:hypothetical protein
MIGTQVGKFFAQNKLIWPFLFRTPYTETQTCNTMQHLKYQNASSLLYEILKDYSKFKSETLYYFRGVKWLGCHVDHPPHVVLRLKKQ